MFVGFYEEMIKEFRISFSVKQITFSETSRSMGLTNMYGLTN